MAKKNDSNPSSVRFMDHTASVLSIYPALACLVLAGLLHFGVVSAGLSVWIFFAVTVFWYISERYDFDRTGAILALAIIGFTVFGTMVLELQFEVKIFDNISSFLGGLNPAFNAAFLILFSALHFANVLSSVFWAYFNQRYEVGYSEIKRLRMGGRDISEPRQGLRVEYEPTDYLETFLLGAGKVVFKTRGGQTKFEMERVIGLYRCPLMPWTWFGGKTLQEKIDKILDIQGLFKIDNTDVDAYDDSDDDVEG